MANGMSYLFVFVKLIRVFSILLNIYENQTVIWIRILRRRISCVKLTICLGKHSTEQYKFLKELRVDNIHI